MINTGTVLVLNGIWKTSDMYERLGNEPYHGVIHERHARVVECRDGIKYSERPVNSEKDIFSCEVANLTKG